MSKKPMQRCTILRTAADLTGSKRGKVHGDFVLQHECAAEFWAVYDRWNKRPLGARDAALKMALLKFSRILTGDPGEPDHYMDAAAYVAGAGEAQG